MAIKKSIIQRTVKIVLFVLLVPLAALGIYSLFMDYQYNSMRAYSEGVEQEREYHEHLLYREDVGEPLLLVNPEYERTLFFMEGFRAQAPAGMYEEQLRRLHNEFQVNVVVPVYGLQSWPFEQRNAQWHFQEDMRQVLQIYNAYTANLSEGHRIVTASMSFGTLVNLTIAAFGDTKPDEIILYSPLNTGMDYQAAGPVVRWLSKQTSWLRYIIAFTKPGAAPSRESVWDIVNPNINRLYNAMDLVNPEDNATQAYLSELTAEYLETGLAPLVSDCQVSVVWGDDDLFFTQEGFENLATILEQSGNSVETRALDDSGHMVLLDNSAEAAWSQILSALGIESRW
ncbi:MAG: hypothetical protein ACLFR1_15760 [Spirochaetia bacterium]